MSKLGDMFVLAQQVSIAAKEEASRYDLPQVDVDHVLLALLVGGGPAGELLRAQGLTLDAARRATEQVRADHVARLGFTPPPAEPGPIRDPSMGGMDWTPRAVRTVNSSRDRADDLALLTALLDEPSGLVVEILKQLDIDLEAFRVALAERKAAAAPGRRAGVLSQDWPAATHTGFAPAPVADVWALVSNLARRPEWDSTVRSVRLIQPDLWEVHAAPARPDGRPVRRRPDFVRSHYRLTAYQPDELVEWEVTLPNRRPDLARYRLAVRCRPASGGTTVDLTFRWSRRTGWQGRLQALLAPLIRLMGKQTLMNYAASISRALR